MVRLAPVTNGPARQFSSMNWASTNGSCWTFSHLCVFGSILSKKDPILSKRKEVQLRKDILPSFHRSISFMKSNTRFHHFKYFKYFFKLFFKWIILTSRRKMKTLKNTKQLMENFPVLYALPLNTSSCWTKPLLELSITKSCFIWKAISSRLSSQIYFQ